MNARSNDFQGATSRATPAASESADGPVRRQLASSLGVEELSTRSSPTAISLIRDCGQGRSPCGYCGSSEDTSCSYGMHADVLTVDAYQALLDRGWRRSGSWVYKPLHARTCCQLITIRLAVDGFKPNKEQRRVQRRWESYLNGTPPLPTSHQGPQGTSPKRPRSDEDDNDGDNDGRFTEHEVFARSSQTWDDANSCSPKHTFSLGGGGKRQRSAVNLTELEVALNEEDHKMAPVASITNEDSLENPVKTIHELEQLLSEALGCCLKDKEILPVQPEYLRSVMHCRPKVTRLTPKQRKRLPPEFEFTSPFAFQIAAALVSTPSHLVAEKLVQNVNLALLPRCVTGVQHLDGHINFRVQRCDRGRRPAEDNGDGFTTTSKNNVFPTSGGLVSSKIIGHRNFELRMVPSSDPSLDVVEFELYKKYQVKHHGDDPAEVTVSSFHRFLCDSPLIPVRQENTAVASSIPPCGFGSFHQQYWVDDRLVAVGVVDVLPKCLSSKYLFWDPDLAFLSLGKLTSLLEIEWVREMSRVCQSLKYYYLGYYVHSCRRMRYKADFGPADVLCPVAQCWVPFDRVKAVLATDVQFPSLAAVPGALDGLGPEYCVTNDGVPALPPRIPTADEVASVRMYIPSEWSSRNTSGGAASMHEFLNLIKSGGTIVTFGVLCMAGILGNDVLLRLRRRLERWMVVVGPAWRMLVYRL